MNGEYYSGPPLSEETAPTVAKPENAKSIATTTKTAPETTPCGLQPRARDLQGIQMAEPEAVSTWHTQPLQNASRTDTTPCDPQASSCDPQGVLTEDRPDQNSEPVPHTKSAKYKGIPTETQPPYLPPVPFPQRRTKQELNEKFVEVLNQLTISIPFTDALIEILSYAKFLKDILSNKRRLKDCRSVQLNHECNAILSRELPPKLGDGGQCTIPCHIGNAVIEKVLCDLGASVSLMSYTVFQRIGV